LGAKANEEKVIGLSLPSDFSQKEYAGKPAKFTIGVFEVKEKRLPEVNDEFAKSAGNYTSLKELREKISLDLKEKLQAQSKLALESQILDKLLSASDFDLPQGVVQAQQERLFDNMLNDLKDKGVSEEEIKKNEQTLRDKADAAAKRLVKVYFILEEVAKRESIKVEPAEVEKEIEAMAKRGGRGVDEIKKYIEENELLDKILLELRETKALEFLLDNARVNDE